MEKQKINIIYKFYGYIFYRFYRYYVDKGYKKEIKGMRMWSGSNMFDKLMKRDKWIDGADDAISWISALLMFNFLFPFFIYFYNGPDRAERTIAIVVLVPLTFVLYYALRRIFIKTKKYKIFVNRWKNESRQHKQIGLVIFWAYLILSLFVASILPMILKDLFQ